MIVIPLNIPLQLFSSALMKACWTTLPERRPHFKEIINALIINQQQSKEAAMSSNSNSNNSTPKEEDPIAFLPWRIDFNELYADQQGTMKLSQTIDNEDPVGRGNFANVYR